MATTLNDIQIHTLTMQMMDAGVDQYRACDILVNTQTQLITQAAADKVMQIVERAVAQRGLIYGT